MPGCCSGARSTSVETACPSCSDLLGQDAVCCGAISSGDEVYESFTAEQVREAAFAALGLGSECGCS